MRSEAEANSKIPRFARNKLRNPMKNEIAAPFGLAMTPCNVKIFNAFVLNQLRGDSIKFHFGGKQVLLRPPLEPSLIHA